MTATLDREVVAQRLLGGTIRRSYQPEVDIDWDAPIDPHKYFLPPQVVSLYGTPYWEEMTEAQRIELSRGRRWRTCCRSASGSRTSSTGPCCAS